MRQEVRLQMADDTRQIANVGDRLRCFAIRETTDAQEQMHGPHVPMVEPLRLHKATRTVRRVLIKVVDQVHSYLYEQNGSEGPVMVS
jgi:hypothetical protein